MFFQSNFFQGKVELMPNYCQAVKKFTPVIRSVISMIAMIAIVAIIAIIAIIIIIPMIITANLTSTTIITTAVESTIVPM